MNYNLDCLFDNIKEEKNIEKQVEKPIEKYVTVVRVTI